MIVNHWQPTFTQAYGHIFPESYLCLDLEYTGWSAEKDLVWEIGHVLVEDRMVTDRLSVILDWTRHDVIPQRWLRDAIARSNARMAAAGKDNHLTWELLQTGIHPDEALKFCYQLIRKAQQRELCFVGHNIYSTDERMLKAHFEGFLSKEFHWEDNDAFDTGGIEKASLAMEQGKGDLKARKTWWLPEPGDTLRSYFHRVCHYPAKGIKWNLSDAIDRYGLIAKNNLDMRQAHRADFDAYLSHLLMEQYRSDIFVNHAGESMVASPAAFGRGFEQAAAEKRQQRAEAAEEVIQQEAQVVAKATAPKGFNRTRRRGQRSL